MENFSLFIFSAIGLLCFSAVGISILIIIDKNEKIRNLQNLFGKLKDSFNNLDEQAKLIVKTDLELNKTQEELDKRLGGLDALQKISRLISTTLDEGQIFDLLHQALMTNLEFEKSLILIYSEQQAFQNRVTIGFSEEKIPELIAELEKDAGILDALRDGHSLSSTNSSKSRRESIVQIFGTEHFVFAPIVAQKGIMGLVFVGNHSNAATITQGDEEIISILASLIGQALENARSF